MSLPQPGLWIASGGASQPIDYYLVVKDLELHHAGIPRFTARPLGASIDRDSRCQVRRLAHQNPLTAEHRDHTEISDQRDGRTIGL